MKQSALIFRFRVALILFILGLVISGITAFPLLLELRILANMFTPDNQSGLAVWIHKVRDGLEVTYTNYPWVAYGTDWLVFGHLVIAMFFIGPLMSPLSSRPNLITGIVACLAIFPLALSGLSTISQKVIFLTSTLEIPDGTINVPSPWSIGFHHTAVRIQFTSILH